MFHWKQIFFNLTVKTKIMVIDKQNSGNNILLDGLAIEQVSEFGDLGSLMNIKNDSSTEKIGFPLILRDVIWKERDFIYRVVWKLKGNADKVPVVI